MNGDIRRVISDFFNVLMKVLKQNPEFSLNTDFQNPYGKFPHGCCKITSIVLSKFLRNNFEIDTKCISGVDNTENTHVWLEYDMYIIDLTAKQFSSELDDIMIAIKGDTFHNLYERRTEINTEDIRNGHQLLEILQAVEKEYYSNTK